MTTPSDLADPFPVVPITNPFDRTVRIPGSKSYTNRALLVAALADGESTITGLLKADDTEAMIAALPALGAVARTARSPTSVTIHGTNGRPGPVAATIDAHLSGTTARFMMAAAARCAAPITIDGGAPLRERPMHEGVRALRSLGVAVDEPRHPGHLPLTIHGTAERVGVDREATAQRTTVPVRGDVSSQFLSGLLMMAPCWPGGLTLTIDGPLVSRPYIDMTLDVMRAFGADPHWADGHTITVPPSGYAATTYAVEPDASAASYAFAAAAICRGTCRVDGLGSTSRQGDLRLAALLGDMGATVEQTTTTTSVTGTTTLRGIEVDMADCSDVAQTLAAVAVFADTPTTITGIGFIRGKESDRIGDTITELTRCGIRADELPDGIRVHPGPPRPSVVRTYHDHRMAMSFALLGLRSPGIEIADPGCVAKTFPDYFSLLESLRSPSR